MLMSDFAHDVLVHSREGQAQPLWLPHPSYFSRQCPLNCGVELEIHSPLQAELRLQALTFSWHTASFAQMFACILNNLGLGLSHKPLVLALGMLQYVHMRNFSECGAAYYAPPSVGLSRQEYWSGVPLPSPSDGSTWIKFIFKSQGITKKMSKIRNHSKYKAYVLTFPMFSMLS